MTTAIKYIALFAAILILGMSCAAGVGRQEKLECKNWAVQAANYKDFYLAKWQQDQCDHWGIEVIPQEKKPEPVVLVAEAQRGMASWYDYDLGGQDQRCTKDSQPCYSQRASTCASRDYAKGTTLEVRPVKLTPGTYSPAVYCKVNDYGPEESTGRIIDLSSHAFAQLTDLRHGLIEVSVEEVK